MSREPVGSWWHQRKLFTPPCSCICHLISPSVTPLFPVAFEPTLFNWLRRSAADL